MFEFIETAVVAATLALSAGGATVFTFPDPGSAAGEEVVALVSHHTTLGRLPAQFGWVKRGEVTGREGGPRAAVYTRTRAAGDAGYVLVAGAAPYDVPAVDARAMGVLVTLSVPPGASRVPAVGMFDGVERFAPAELFKSPVQVATAAAAPGDAFVWMVFDNTYKVNKGAEGFVAEGTGVGLPVHRPAVAEPVVNLNFNVNRHYSVGLGKRNDVPYAGVWLKYTAPAAPVCR
jgi:hypothetical protein